MKAVDSQDPKGLIHSCLGSHSHWLPAAQPHSHAEGLVTGAWGSLLSTLHISPAFQFQLMGQPLGREGKLDLVGASQ